MRESLHPRITPSGSVKPIDRVAELFAENRAVNTLGAESQAPAIARATATLVNSLLGGGKILCCGNGSSAADAQAFAAQLQHRFQRERPGLPALSLGASPTILTAIASADGYSEIFAKQLSTLGHPGDVLLLLSVSGADINMLAATDAAHEQQMDVVALTGGDGGMIAGRLRSNDTEIRAPSHSMARVLENHRLALHCVCDLIDLQLMGGETA